MGVSPFDKPTDSFAAKQHAEEQKAQAHPILLRLGKSVLSVELYDLEQGLQIATFHRQNSYCTFTEAIQHQEFELKLRLDWGDLVEGEPTLDIDVFRINANGTRRRIKPKRTPVHHVTLSTFVAESSEPRTYDLDYEGLRMRLLARKTFGVGTRLSVSVVDPSNNVN